MKQNNSFSALLPYLVAAVTFFSVCALYFAPVIEGKQLPSHDMTQYEGMRQDIVDHQKRFGEDPQWAGRMFSGMPSYLIAVTYDSIFIKNAMRNVEKAIYPVMLVFLAMAGFFIMSLLCGIDPWVGIVPSLAYGLSTYFFLIIGAGHVTKMVALAYAPMMLGGMFFAMRRDMWMGAALTALFASLEIAASHLQITYYFLFIMVAFWINELCVAIKEKGMPRFLKATGLLLLAAVLAVGSNFISLYNVESYSKESMRGGTELKSKEGKSEMSGDKGLSLQYATAWSYGVGESLNMFIPDMRGGASGGSFAKDGAVASELKKYDIPVEYLPAYGGSTYWGKQPITGGPTYLGASVIFLAVLALFLLRGRYKWWIISVSAVAIMLSWGSNFMWFTELFFNHVPGYNKFRTVSMILVIVQWSVPMLAMMGLYKLYRADGWADGLKKGILNALYITGGAALFFVLFGGSMFDFAAEMDRNLPEDIRAAMRGERASMMRMDALRSLLMVLLAAGGAWVMAKGWVKKGYVLVALGVIVCADLATVNARFLPQSKFVQSQSMQVKPTQADLQILQDTTPGYRVANFAVSPFSDASTSYFHRSIGGYHGAKLQRYQDIIDRHLSVMNMEVYNMLNTKYVITPVKESGELRVELNPDANGAAWFVDKVRFSDTPDEEIDALSDMSTKYEAVVDRRFAPIIPENISGGDSTASIGLAEYRVNRLTYRYNSSQPRLAVFSEIYYPKGWSATIDGEPLPYLRADYILRAAVLPAGEHTVVFSFEIPHFRLLSSITWICSILILLSIAAAYAVPKYLCRKNGPGQQ